MPGDPVPGAGPGQVSAPCQVPAQAPFGEAAWDGAGKSMTRVLLCSASPSAKRFPPAQCGQKTRGAGRPARCSHSARPRPWPSRSPRHRGQPFRAAGPSRLGRPLRGRGTGRVASPRLRRARLGMLAGSFPLVFRPRVSPASLAPLPLPLPGAPSLPSLLRDWPQQPHLAPPKMGLLQALHTCTSGDPEAHTHTSRPNSPPHPPIQPHT